MKLVLAVCIPVILITTGTGADVVFRSTEPAELIHLMESDEIGTTAEFNLLIIEAEEAYIPEFGTGTVFRAPDAGFLAEPGSPDLPVYRRMIKIPNTGEITLEILEEETAILGIYSIPPFQPLVLRSGESFPYRINDEIYSNSALYPGEPVEIESVSILRDLRVAWVKFNPVRYNPVTGEVFITSKVSFRITCSGTGENELERFSNGITRSFLPFYEQVTGFENTSNLVDGSFVFIGNSDGISDAQDLINWKIQRGYDVHIGIVPDIGATATEIDAWIEDAYNTWPNPPEWLIIIGDENTVPPPTASGTAADNQYGVIGTETTVPSIHVGRIIGNDSEDIPYQTWKIIQHEMNPYEPSPSWFQNAIVIGSGDVLDPLHSYQHTQIMMAAAMTVQYYCEDPEFGGMPPNLADIKADVNDGCSLIGYIGHGGITGWGTSGFSNSDVNTLTNGRKLPWINSIACSNGQFQGSTLCFAEAWMMYGSTSDCKGAIGIMAATTGSPFGPTDSMAINTFRAYFEQDNWHMGAAVDYGKLKVFEYYGFGDSGNNNMHMIFGCPELDIYHETSPIPVLSGDHASEIGIGTYTVTVTADGNPVEGALVGVSQDYVLLDGARTDASGVATLDITSIPGSEVVDITATYHNCAPYFGTTSPLGIGGEGTGDNFSLILNSPTPNPFNSTTIIGFQIPLAEKIRLDVFDVSGRIVRSLENSEMNAGFHAVEWNGRDNSGSSVPDGVYLYRLTTSGGSLVRSCVVLR